jgi:hypothetical protein
VDDIDKKLPLDYLVNGRRHVVEARHEGVAVQRRRHRVQVVHEPRLLRRWCRVGPLVLEHRRQLVVGHEVPGQQVVVVMPGSRHGCWFGRQEQQLVGYLSSPQIKPPIELRRWWSLSSSSIDRVWRSGEKGEERERCVSEGASFVECDRVCGERIRRRRDMGGWVRVREGWLISNKDG